MPAITLILSIVGLSELPSPEALKSAAAAQREAIQSFVLEAHGTETQMQVIPPAVEEDARKGIAPLFTMPAVFEKLFALAGGDLNAALTHDPMELITRYFWDDGTTLDAWQDPDRFAAEVETKLGDPAPAVKRYLKRAKKIYDTTADIFLYGNPWDPLNIVRTTGWRALAGLPFIAPFTTMDRFHRRYFKDERTIQLFDRYATYTGSDPYRAPATLAIIPHVEYAIGARNLRGGVTALVRAMHALAEKNGAIFHFNAPVEKILRKSDRAVGIEMDKADEAVDSLNVAMAAGIALYALG